MRQELDEMSNDPEVFKYDGARGIPGLLKGELPGPEASAGKMMWVEGHQRVQELAMEIQGAFSQLTHGSAWAVADGLGHHTILRSRPTPTEGGTTEVERTIPRDRRLLLRHDA